MWCGQGLKHTKMIEEPCFCVICGWSIDNAVIDKHFLGLEKEMSLLIGTNENVNNQGRSLLTNGGVSDASV